MKYTEKEIQKFFNIPDYVWENVSKNYYFDLELLDNYMGAIIRKDRIDVNTYSENFEYMCEDMAYDENSKYVENMAALFCEMIFDKEVVLDDTIYQKNIES